MKAQQMLLLAITLQIIAVLARLVMKQSIACVNALLLVRCNFVQHSGLISYSTINTSINALAVLPTYIHKDDAVRRYCRVTYRLCLSVITVVF
jgi:hypothetical protein